MEKLVFIKKVKKTNIFPTKSTKTDSVTFVDAVICMTVNISQTQFYNINKCFKEE